MKITFLINTLRVGGAAKMVKYVANIAAEVFDEVSMISMYDDSYEGKDLNDDIKIVCLGFEKLNRFKRQFIMVSKTRRAIENLRPDYVCSFISHVCVIGRLATLKNRNIKYISAERGDPFTESFLWKKLIKWTYKNSNYCFFQLNKARDFFGKEVAKKSFVIPNPFLVKDCITPYQGERNKTIVSAGRFSSEKCYNVLIEAFAEIQKLYPDYRLILYGEGPLLDSYKKQASKLNILNKVEFPGYVKSVPNAIYKEGVFVLSSLLEGIPNSLIEAMSAGIPCISTDCTPGGPDFLMKGGERGILIPVKNVDAMISAIKKIISDKTLANYYGGKATEIVEELNESKISQMWKAAFNKIKNREIRE